MRRNESLGLSRYWSEDAFLGEALAIGAATILGLVEAGATNLASVSTVHNLPSRSCRVPCGADSIYKLLLFADVVQAAVADSPFADAGHTVVRTFAAPVEERDIDLDVVVGESGSVELGPSPGRLVASANCRLRQHSRLRIMMDQSRPFCDVCC